MNIRHAKEADLDRITEIYHEIITAEEQGPVSTGWQRGVYPARATAEAALARGDLFVLAEDGKICGSAIINRMQDEAYRGAAWTHDAPDHKVCVLHTLAVSPSCSGKGYGSKLIDFYEACAARLGCTALRMDTNVHNTVARGIYRRRGYQEIGIVTAEFNGVPDTSLVLLEKDCAPDIMLDNGHARVTVSRSAYTGQRFDNTGIITQVALQEGGETTTFCTRERLEPGLGSGGIGLANEFDIDGPASYAETKAGEAFLKIGVGWLRKPAGEDYFFMNPYEVVDAGQQDMTCTDTGIVIRWDSGVRGGYGCLYDKSIELQGRKIRIHYQLTNTGTKTFTTREYAHNFVRIGETEVQEDTLQLELLRPDVAHATRGDFIDYSLEESNKSFAGSDCAGVRGWRLSRIEDGRAMRETVDFEPVKIGVWSRKHVVSCELFCEAHLAPGESTSWTRVYEILWANEQTQGSVQ